GGFGGELGELLERRRIVHREIREDLAIEIHTGGLERRDEARVGGAVLAARSVDAHDPEAPEVTLLQLPARVLVLPRLAERLDRFLEAGAAASIEALRL